MVSTALLTIHLIGVALGLGGATIGDIAILRSLWRSEPQPREHLIHLSQSIWLGLALLGVSGVALFALKPSDYLHSSGFIAKMILVAGLTANGIFLHRRLPRLRVSTATLFSGAVSIVSWYGALAIAMFRSQLNLTLPDYLGLYGLSVVGVSLLYIISHAYLRRSKAVASEAGLTLTEQDELARLCREDEDLRKALSSYVRQHT